MGVQEAEEAVRLMKERHERELREALNVLRHEQYRASKVLGPWTKNAAIGSDLRAWLKGPSLGVPVQRRTAARVVDNGNGYKLVICLPQRDRRELVLCGVSLDFTIQAATAILRGEGWTVLD